MKTLWLTQIAAVLRLEMRKTFFSRRGLVGLLAGFAAAADLRRTLDRDDHQSPPLRLRPGHQYLRRHLPDCSTCGVVIFFGCLGIFMNLFRGEVLDRSLHYYFLAPVRREVLVIGKYLAGTHRGAA